MGFWTALGAETPPSVQHGQSRLPIRQRGAERREGRGPVVPPTSPRTDLCVRGSVHARASYPTGCRQDLVLPRYASARKRWRSTLPSPVLKDRPVNNLSFGRH